MMYLLNKLLSISLFIKIMGLVVGLSVLFGFLVIFEIQKNLYYVLEENLTMRGTAIAQDLAKRAAGFILTGDIVGLSVLIRETKESHKEISYILILDISGKLALSTFEDNVSVSSKLLAANKIHKKQNTHLEILNTERGIIRDIAIPILGGRTGVLRIGFAEKYVDKDVYKVRKRIIVAILLIALLGIFIAYILVKIINKPVKELTRVAKTIKSGNLQERAQIWSHDEMGQFAETFNTMVETLLNRNEELQKLTESLREKEVLRLKLVDKLINAQEDERKRIARELHDHTSQTLSSLKIGLKSLDSLVLVAADKEKIEQLKSFLNCSLEEIHNLAVELRPPLLDDFGFFIALERYAKGFEKNSGININYKVKGFNIEERLLPAFEINLYRVIQESLTNIEKHSGATLVEIIFEKHNSLLTAIVKDNGCGFNCSGEIYHYAGSSAIYRTNKGLINVEDTKIIKIMPKERKPLGIFGMQERISLLGGSFSIESKIGEGTTVFIELPLW